ncbi:aminotransferase class-III [Heterostelium album PN500]|uniref:Aminotransferase class-III n=1 Tax=Heterostelium pallidum (strain ATCC 26659 / Pp 5 / PN500) TaxID=670386 RepID=D3BQM5_HETP5|nr:aminotransferase class-III [Heterostelium album PN500]EFA76445.1 aminotransferase class-III [Heterostelium album PN500]|eukprot:XP_020428577.1 aminotransferase class-III [Heterostelium album PN500]
MLSKQLKSLTSLQRYLNTATSIRVANFSSKSNYNGLYEKHQKIAEKKMSQQEILDVIKSDTLFSWNATGPASSSALVMAKGEGVYFYDQNGKKFIDFNSQAMCSNLGHTVPQEVITAVNDQLKSAAYAYPCAIVTEIKAKLSLLLADLLPGDLGHLFYTSGGAESNETAMRMARLYTGRHKILARYRSYHGATLGSISLTGDPRRWAAEPAASGVVHFMDPFPLSFKWGENEEEVTKKSLQYLREVIAYEGGKNIAAIFIEPVTGTNGILKAPRGYLEGMRQICDEHGILMVCDEVMNGFGRTGEMFGFMNSDGVVPDIVTMAKGINGAYLPLGAVACRDHVANFFQKNPIGIGSTYNSHPVTLASAYGALQYFLKNRVLDNVNKMESVLIDCLEQLKAKHPTVKGYRALGLFGIVELQKNAKGEPFVEYNGPAHPAMGALKADFNANGLYTLLRWSSFFTNPPLIINEKELREGFAIIDKALTNLDKHFEK